HRGAQAARGGPHRPAAAAAAAPAVPGAGAAGTGAMSAASTPAPGPGPGGPSIVVTGGGSGGHIEPALAFADAVRERRPDARITALGTEKGLDATLTPARGYPLELIPPVPLPRKPTADLLRLPGNIRTAVGRVREVLAGVGAQ